MKEALHVISLNEAGIMPQIGQYSVTDYNNQNGYYLFNLFGGRKKIKVLLSDILLVRAIKTGHADKLLYLKGNVVHIIRGHGLDELIRITGSLLQCNKQDLISPEAVNYLEEDTIYLNNLYENGKPIFISLNRTYKKSFLDFFRYVPSRSLA